MLACIDVGGTKTAIQLVNNENQVVADRIMPTIKAHDFVQSLVAAIDATLDSAGLRRNSLAGIGIGLPGMVNADDGTVRHAVNLGLEKPVALVDMLSTEFLAPILIENDTKLAAVGVAEKYGLDHMAYLGLGTGVAAGIVLNGKLWRGATGLAGEIGHMVLANQNVLLEDVLSGPSIVRYGQDVGLSVTRASDIYRLALNDNASARRIVKDISCHISRIIHWLIMTYDIEKVVLGGGVTSIGDAFLTPVLSAVAQLRLTSPFNQLMLSDDKIDLLSADFNAGLWGACSLARQASQVRV